MIKFEGLIKRNLRTKEYYTLTMWGQTFRIESDTISWEARFTGNLAEDITEGLRETSADQFEKITITYVG